MPYGRKDTEMITDNFLLLESAQVLVRAAATYVSTNTIDLLQNRDLGAGHGAKVVWNIEVAYASGTSVQWQQILSAAANLGSPVLVEPGVIVPVANLVIGGMVTRMIPELLGGPAGLTAPLSGFAGIGSPGLRYFGTQSIGVGTFTTGQHSTRVVVDVVDVKHYASGYTIL